MVQGPFATVFWVAKRACVAQKVAKFLVPLQPGTLFATLDSLDGLSTRDSTAKNCTDTVLNHGRRAASRCALHWTDLAGRRYRHDRSVSLPFIFLFSQAGRPQQAIPATHMTVVPPWNNFCEAGPPVYCMCFVLDLSGLSELLPLSPSLKIIIFRRLMALATDSGTSSSFLRTSIPALRISVVSPVSLSPRPLSADRDTPSKDYELFGAADDMHQRAIALSGAAGETVDIATIPKLEGW